MQDNGPLIALVVFILASILFGVMAWSNYNDIQGTDPLGQQGASTLKAEVIKAAKVENEQLVQDIQGLETQISVKRNELRIQVERGEMYEGIQKDYEEAHAVRRKWLDAAGVFARQAKDLGGKVSEEKAKTEAQIRKDENESRERAEAEKRVLLEKKDAASSRMTEARKGMDRDDKAFRAQRNYEQAELDELKNRLQALTQREVERANKNVQVDGRVVRSDPTLNLVVINRGSSDGIKAGYRFEVFAVRAGNKKVSKGYLEVKKVEPSISECIIYTKVVALPRDPMSEYIAPEPEYQYSPFQESGKRGSTAQPLSAAPKVVTMGMNAEDPIVEGDLIQNPFYSPDKAFTFYIAGDKAIVRGVQKSAIAYQWPHIERVLKGYGANVAVKVDLGVDFIIAQKNPQDDQEYLKAVSLGIPVIYEWELFRFLDQR